MEVKLFKPHTKQRECIDRIEGSSSKYFIINCGRQFGKSMLSENLLLKWSLETPNTTGFWVSPIYSQAKKVYDELNKALDDTGLVLTTNRSELWIKLLNGSTIHFKSGEKPDNLRGYTLDWLIIDEAAFVKDEIWTEVLRPATLVKGKRVIFISTPKGKNYFYNLYQRGMSNDYPDYVSLKYTSYDTPYISKEEIEDAKQTLPTDIFRQEILAEFIEDGGEVFKNYTDIQTEVMWRKPSPDERYWAGLDLGRQNDYTVLTILNNYNQVCYIYRENKTNWVNIIDNVVSILNQYNAKLLIEVNSIGDVIYEQIKRKYSKIEPFNTTNKSKEEIINNLIVNINDQILTLPTKELFEPLDTELKVFTFEWNPRSRKVRYFSPSGFHDDCVMSLALAVESKRQLLPKKYVVV